MTAPTNSGAGIYSLKQLDLENSTVAYNRAAEFGGGVFAAGRAMITNTTVSQNAVQNSNTHSGGVLIQGELWLTNVTLAENRNGGIRIGGPGGELSLVHVKNTLFANNQGGNCTPTIVDSLGNNLDSGATCNLQHANDRNNTNPLLEELAYNASTWQQTHALMSGSPAINAGSTVGCPAVDQRGVARPQADLCDIGAYEKEVLAQSINFAPLPDKVFGDAPFALNATASSGLAVKFQSESPTICSVSGNTVTLVALGTCTIVATQTGNAQFNPASAVSQSFTVKNTDSSGALESKVYLPTIQR